MTNIIPGKYYYYNQGMVVQVMPQDIHGIDFQTGIVEFYGMVLKTYPADECQEPKWIGSDLFKLHIDKILVLNNQGGIK